MNQLEIQAKMESQIDSIVNVPQDYQLPPFSGDYNQLLLALKLDMFLAKMRELKPIGDFDNLRVHMRYVYNIKKYLGYFIIFIMIFQRPIWCVNKGSEINFQCTESYTQKNATIYYTNVYFLFDKITAYALISFCQLLMTLIQIFQS